MPVSTLNGQPTTDHEFARWLRKFGWNGEFTASGDHVTFTAASGRVLAIAKYDNRSCTFKARTVPETP